MDFFQQRGYASINPRWPGESETVQATRENPDAMANFGVSAITDVYIKEIQKLNEPPIVIGHSFGGLIAQIILSRGLAVAGVAIDPAPMKGVWQLQLSVLKASLPILGNPFNITKAKSLTFDQFKYAFANRLDEKEAKELYDQATIPSPARPLFQEGFATFVGNETEVETDNIKRGPLLITGSEKDNIAPPIFGKASAGKYNKEVVTEFKLFSNRGHSLASDHGWKEIAEYVLVWLKKNGF
ncbi:MAG TPA: alpha/beta hydrolase [Cytophagales bacterium]|jgi:non-heme chloroperoxidase|nr:alpha/beta hydrolase [Cytophagales bacterium]